MSNCDGCGRCLLPAIKMEAMRGLLATAESTDDNPERDVLREHLRWIRDVIDAKKMVEPIFFPNGPEGIERDLNGLRTEQVLEAKKAAVDLLDEACVAMARVSEMLDVIVEIEEGQ